MKSSFGLFVTSMLLIARCLIDRIDLQYIKILGVGDGLALDIKKSFGARVQKLRKENGLSQEKFALSIDMDRTYLASVEAGRRNLSLQNIKKIADGLEMSLSDLFHGL